jgi:hypothetical protein
MLQRGSETGITGEGGERAEVGYHVTKYHPGGRSVRPRPSDPLVSSDHYSLPLSLPLPIIARHFVPSLHVMVPVLSLATDALIDLDGTDAITGLWTSKFILSLFLASHPSLPAFVPDSVCI